MQKHVEDYMEITIQFGYVALFGTTFPFMCLFFIIINLIQMRSSAI